VQAIRDLARDRSASRRWHPAARVRRTQLLPADARRPRYLDVSDASPTRYRRRDEDRSRRGARPNFMKIAPVMKAVARAGFAQQKLVHTGQHYDVSM